MEIDKETEGQLAQLSRIMQCMGTEDEETLVRNFQQIIAPHADLSVELCRFFLDMNNWNLQAALGSFYDYNAQQMVAQSVPLMQFIADVTIGEGESVPPCSRFVKTWRLRNPGMERWPIGCSLRHIEGDLLANADHVDVGALAPGETADVSLTMTSPPKQGVYQSRWRMFTDSGLPFGEAIWCIIVVDDSGLLDLTQQFASANCITDSTTNASSTKWSASTTDSDYAHLGNPFQSGIKTDAVVAPNVQQLPAECFSEKGFSFRPTGASSLGFDFDDLRLSTETFDQVPENSIATTSSATATHLFSFCRTFDETNGDPIPARALISRPKRNEESTILTLNNTQDTSSVQSTIHSASSTNIQESSTILNDVPSTNDDMEN